MVKYIILVLLACSGCCQSPEIHVETAEFHRIFMHSPGNYSVLINTEEGRVVAKKFPIFNNDKNKHFLITDVPLGKPMFYLVKSYSGHNCINQCLDGYYKEVEFHIHEINDVDGGETDNGKFGKVPTSVVE